MKNIVFRVDYSHKIGLGHLMRCLVLAEQFKSANVIFACFHVSDSSIITNLGYKIISLESNEITEFIKIIKKLQPNLVIIDTYELGFNEEKKIKQSIKTKLMVLDDMYEKHYCDMLLNHNAYAQASLYQGKLLPTCKVKCGSKYTLLRDEFRKEKAKKREKDGILLALGGSDSANLNQKVLEKIPENVRVRVVTSSANIHLESLIKYIEQRKNASLHLNTKQMAKLMNKSKFGIITPSVTANEALFMGMDFMSIKTASNQSLMEKYLTHKGYYCISNIDEFSFEKIKPQL